VQHQRVALFGFPLELLAVERSAATRTGVGKDRRRLGWPFKGAAGRRSRRSTVAIKVTAAVTAPNVNPMKRRLDSSAMGHRLGLLSNAADQTRLPLRVRGGQLGRRGLTHCVSAVSSAILPPSGKDPRRRATESFVSALDMADVCEKTPGST